LRIKLSNSQASPSSLRESRASREFYFRFRSRRSVFVFALPKRGSRAPYGAKSPCPCKEHGTDPAGPASPYGAPLRRLQSLGPRCPLTPAWPFGSGRGHGTSPGRLFYAGRPIQGLPGPRYAKTAGAGAAPHPRSDRSAERPSVDGDDSDLCERRIAIQIKIFVKGGSHGANRAGSRGRGLERIVGTCPPKLSCPNRSRVYPRSAN